jgi:dTDP-4-amino-4,6-dideoxygalactose transaminase
MSAWELPALLGGPAVRPQGPPDWPGPDPDVVEAVRRACADGSWGRYHGGHAERLEQRLRDYHGARHALVCGSGTFAVELALRALKVGPGDDVILASYDYPGNFLSVHAVGAQPVLVDVAAGHWNLSPDVLAGAAGPAVRAVVASHLHGGLVRMRELTAWAREHGLAVVEDAAQVPGAVVEGRRAGTWGDAGVLSFGGSKLLSAGRGGALLTDRDDVAQRARTHLMRGNLVCPLSELQAAALLPQLDRLDARNERRARAVAWLIDRLAGLPGLRPFVNTIDGSSPGYYKVGFQFDEEVFGLSRARLVAALRAEGVAVAEGFPAAHVGRSPRRFRRGSDLAEADRAHRGAVVLHHPVLLGSPADLEEIVRAWHKVHHHAALLAASPDGSPWFPGEPGE